MAFSEMGYSVLTLKVKVWGSADEGVGVEPPTKAEVVVGSATVAEPPPSSAQKKS